MSEFNLGNHLGLCTIADPSSGENKKEERARTEPMLIIPYIDSYGYATGRYKILSKVGTKDPSEYEANMDGQGGREDCGCPDMQIRNPSAGCKHINRIGIQMTEGNLPKPGEPAHAYMEWLETQQEELLGIKADLQMDGPKDSDKLREVSFALHHWSKVMDEMETTADDTDDESGRDVRRHDREQKHAADAMSGRKKRSSQPVRR